MGVHVHFPPSVIAHLARLQVLSKPSLVSVMEERAHAALQPIVVALKKWYPKFPTGINHLLDIGCGLAIIDALLVKALPLANVYLIDGNGQSTRIADKYSVDQYAWDNVQIGADMVRANLVGDRKTDVLAISVGRSSLIEDLHGPIDLVISFKSWGHHYPVDKYLPLVHSVLSYEGLIILDIREGTNGVQKMQDVGFELLDRIPHDSVKCKRLVFRRSK